MGCPYYELGADDALEVITLQHLDQSLCSLCELLFLMFEILERIVCGMEIRMRDLRDYQIVAEKILAVAKQKSHLELIETVEHMRILRDTLLPVNPFPERRTAARQGVREVIVRCSSHCTWEQAEGWDWVRRQSKAGSKRALTEMETETEMERFEDYCGSRTIKRFGNHAKWPGQRRGGSRKPKSEHLNGEERNKLEHGMSFYNCHRGNPRIVRENRAAEVIPMSCSDSVPASNEDCKSVALRFFTTLRAKACAVRDLSASGLRWLSRKKRTASAPREKVAELGEETADFGEEAADIGEEAAELGEAAADIGEEAADIGEEAAELGEEAPDIGEEASDIGEEAADIGEEAAELGEEAPDIGEEASDIGEEASDIGEEAADIGEEASDIGEEAADVGEEAADVGEEAPDVGEEAADVGEEAADVGEEAPDVGEEAPDVGEEAADVGEEAPDVGEEAPDVGEEAPDVGEEAPDVGEEAPDVGEEAPDVGEEAPDVGEEAPDVGEEAPDVGEEAPDVGEEAPDVGEEAPDVGEEAPDVGEEAPDVGEEAPDVGEEAPDVGEEAADIGEEAADIGEEAADIGEEAADIGEEAADIGEEAADIGEEAADIGEEAADIGEEAADIGEEAADIGEEAADIGEEAADIGEETAGLNGRTAKVINGTTSETSKTTEGIGWDSLPCHLQEKILLRVEFKDLFRFKTLSKSCNGYIENDAFRRWRGASSSSEGLFTAINYYIKNHAWQCTGFDLRSRMWRALPTFSPTLPAPDAELFKEYSVCGHGGLMCADVSKLPKKGELVVFNPLTRKRRELPPLIFPRSPVLVHMSVNPVTKSYKVIVAGSSAACDEHLSKKVEVFDSETSKWEEAPDLPGPAFGLNEHQAGVSVGGVLYFISFLEDNSRRGVVAFDVESKKWLASKACPIPFSMYSNTLQLVENNAKVYLFSEQERGGSVEHCIDMLKTPSPNAGASEKCQWKNVVRVKKSGGRGLQVYPEYTCVSFGDEKLCMFNTLTRDGVVYGMQDGKQVEKLEPPPSAQKGDNFFSLNPTSFTLHLSFYIDPN